MPPSIYDSLVQSGGFAVLAGVLIFLGNKAQAALVRVLDRVLDQMSKTEVATITLAENVRSLQGEVSALRGHMHTLINGMTSTELRLRALEAGALK